MDHILEIIHHVLPDALRMLPFLFGAYLLMEYMEHKAPDRLHKLMVRGNGSGAFIGALLGCVPQCGFSVAAANLYAGGVVTAGTLLAVFLSTSDEALFVLLSHPDRWVEIVRLLGCKVVLAVAVGLLVDYVGRKKHGAHHHEHIHDLCGECGCGQHHGGILRPALWHTMHVFVFIFVVMFLMELGVHALGEERLAAILLADSRIGGLYSRLCRFGGSYRALPFGRHQLWFCFGRSFHRGRGWPVGALAHPQKCQNQPEAYGNSVCGGQPWRHFAAAGYVREDLLWNNG